MSVWGPIRQVLLSAVDYNRYFIILIMLVSYCNVTMVLLIWSKNSSSLLARSSKAIKWIGFWYLLSQEVWGISKPIECSLDDLGSKLCFCNIVYGLKGSRSLPQMDQCSVLLAGINSHCWLMDGKRKSYAPALFHDCSFFYPGHSIFSVSGSTRPSRVSTTTRTGFGSSPRSATTSRDSRCWSTPTTASEASAPKWSDTCATTSGRSASTSFRLFRLMSPVFFSFPYLFGAPRKKSWS